MSRFSSCSQITIALAAIAIGLAGCAAANNTASGQGEQPHKTMYGLTSEGPTTDLYTELFGPRKPAAPPETPALAAQPAQVQSAVSPPTAPPAQAAAATTRQSKPTAASVSSRQVQPAPAPVEVAQQPPATQPPPEPDVPVAYGITANGPTTDLFTELFGPRRRDGQ